MRKWVVTLPGPQNYNLESDTPAEDLAALGYSAFGLMELDERSMKRWWKYPPVPPSDADDPGQRVGGQPEMQNPIKTTRKELNKKMREFYMRKKGNPLAPDFELPTLDANGNLVPLISPTVMEQLGDRFETILNTLDGLQVSSALSLLETAGKAVMQCPVCTKETGDST